MSDSSVLDSQNNWVSPLDLEQDEGGYDHALDGVPQKMIFQVQEYRWLKLPPIRVASPRPGLRIRVGQTILRVAHRPAMVAMWTDLAVSALIGLAVLLLSLIHI